MANCCWQRGAAHQREREAERCKVQWDFWNLFQHFFLDSVLGKLLPWSVPGEYRVCFSSHRWHQLIRTGWYTESCSKSFTLSARRRNNISGPAGNMEVALARKAPFPTRIRVHRKPCPWRLRESLSHPSGHLCIPFPLLLWRVFSLPFRWASWKHVGLNQTLLIARILLISW